MSGDAQSSSDTELLLGLLEVDPWDPADSETGYSTCHYCGSDVCAGYGKPPRWEHWASCPWMAAANAYGKAPEGHVFYVPPQPESPCPTCGFQGNVDRSKPGGCGPDSTGTFEDHYAHRALEAGFSTINEWLDSMRRPSLLAALPEFHPDRGAIRFIPPPVLDPPPAEVEPMQYNAFRIKMYDPFRNHEWDKPLTDPKEAP